MAKINLCVPLSFTPEFIDIAFPDTFILFTSTVPSVSKSIDLFKPPASIPETDIGLFTKVEPTADSPATICPPPELITASFVPSVILVY